MNMNASPDRILRAEAGAIEPTTGFCPWLICSGCHPRYWMKRMAQPSRSIWEGMGRQLLASSVEGFDRLAEHGVPRQSLPRPPSFPGHCSTWDALVTLRSGSSGHRSRHLDPSPKVPSFAVHQSGGRIREGVRVSAGERSGLQDTGSHSMSLWCNQDLMPYAEEAFRDFCLPRREELGLPAAARGEMQVFCVASAPEVPAALSFAPLGGWSMDNLHKWVLSFRSH